MPACRRLAILAVTAACLSPLPASALDDDVRAYSLQPTELGLCGKDGAMVSSGACKKIDFDALNKRTEKSLQAVLSKAPANIRPLLKRDQDWFNEMVLNIAEMMPQDDDGARDTVAELLRRRATTLDGVAQGFGRSGVAGRWVNAFGSITVTPADAGYRLAIDLRAVYGLDDERRRECRMAVEVKPGQGAWLTGTIEDKPTKGADDGKSEPKKPVAIKLRRQGETLRVVLGEDEWSHAGQTDCTYTWQITGSYFADGRPDGKAPADKADTAFVAPTFDCTRLESATDEEICADPDLAENDQKLNRAWKALLPRLDEATRRTLTEDQRNWVKTQVWQYPEYLHPAWNKTTYFMHFTSDARDRLDRLQKERIALLDGFDDKRTGLVGVWLGYNAILKVTATEDGDIKAVGWKWEQGDWKAGCDFDMTGKVADGKFVSDEKRKNPDTLERDHASLIVNRLDDVFAKKRDGSDSSDEPKCKRNYSNSSTARLFPAKASPDINDFGKSIR